jgi:hypothetical protein
MSTQYTSQTDQILHSLANAGWADATTGSLEAPTGLIYLLRLTAEDLGEPYLQKVETLPGVFRKNLLGNFIVTETDKKPVTIQKYENEEDAVNAFNTSRQE